MSGPDAAKTPHGKGRTRQANAVDEHLLDRELADLPLDLRWREWILRVEAVIFTSAVPVSRGTIASLRNASFLASGPRSPTPGAPYSYVTTKQFLSAFGLHTQRDLTDI